MSDETVFNQMPCLIELYGHNRIAGMVSEVAIGGSALLRVDVPAVDGQLAFTKYYGLGAVYAITPTDETTMRAAVEGMRPRPVEPYLFSLPSKVQSQGDDDFEDDPDFEDDREDGEGF